MTVRELIARLSQPDISPEADVHAVASDDSFGDVVGVELWGPDEEPAMAICLEVEGTGRDD